MPTAAASRSALAGVLALAAAAAFSPVFAAPVTIEHEGRSTTIDSLDIARSDTFDLEDVAEALGFELREDTKREATLRRAEGTIRVRAGRAVVVVDGQPFILGAEVRQHQGRLRVPVDFVTRAVPRLLGVEARHDTATRTIRFDAPSRAVACESFADRVRVTVTTPRPARVGEVVRSGKLRTVTLADVELPAQRGGCNFGEILADLEVEPRGGRTTLTFEVGDRFAQLKVYEVAEARQLVFDFFSDAAEPGVAAAPEPTASAPARDVFDVVVIDPGHGGSDRGAVGPAGLEEKVVNLAIAQELAGLLRENGFTVLLTREADEAKPLSERTDEANRGRADLFLSLHANATAAPNAWGAETYFLHADATDEGSRTLAAFENDATGLRQRGGASGDLEVLLWDMAQQQYLEESSRLAEAVQRELNILAGTRDRGVKQANFLVLRGATMPAVLVEVGFLSNPREEQKLKTAEFRRATAQALLRAVVAFRDQRAARQRQ